MAGKSIDLRRPSRGGATMTEVVAENVRRLRQRRGWTQRDLRDQLAEAGFAFLDVSRPTIVAMESGKRSIEVSELFALAVVLGVSPHLLLYPPPGTDVRGRPRRRRGDRRRVPRKDGGRLAVGSRSARVVVRERVGVGGLDRVDRPYCSRGPRGGCPRGTAPATAQRWRERFSVSAVHRHIGKWSDVDLSELARHPPDTRRCWPSSATSSPASRRRIGAGWKIDRSLRRDQSERE